MASYFICTFRSLYNGRAVKKKGLGVTENHALKNPSPFAPHTSCYQSQPVLISELMDLILPHNALPQIKSNFAEANGAYVKLVR